jgi:hypothetical protein
MAWHYNDWCEQIRLDREEAHHANPSIGRNPQTSDPIHLCSKLGRRDRAGHRGPAAGDPRKPHAHDRSRHAQSSVDARADLARPNTRGTAIRGPNIGLLGNTRPVCRSEERPTSIDLARSRWGWFSDPSDRRPATHHARWRWIALRPPGASCFFANSLPVASSAVVVTNAVRCKPDGARRCPVAASATSPSVTDHAPPLGTGTLSGLNASSRPPAPNSSVWTARLNHPPARSRGSRRHRQPTPRSTAASRTPQRRRPPSR